MPQNASAKLLLIFLLSKCLTLFLLYRRIFPSTSGIYLINILLCNHFYRLASSRLFHLPIFSIKPASCLFAPPMAYRVSLSFFASVPTCIPHANTALSKAFYTIHLLLIFIKKLVITDIYKLLGAVLAHLHV